MKITYRKAIEEAAYYYKKTNTNGYHFTPFYTLTDKEKDLVMKHIAIGEKKENIVVVLDTSLFFSYRKGFAITEDKIYFSKDFFIRGNNKIRSLRYKDYVRIETEPSTKAIKFYNEENIVTLGIGEYMYEVYNFVDKLSNIINSYNDKKIENYDKYRNEMIEALINRDKPNTGVGDVQDFKLIFPEYLKLGDIIKTDYGLFGISAIYSDISNAIIKCSGHYLKTQKSDLIKLDVFTRVKRLNQNKLKIGKVHCKVDGLNIYFHFSNGKTALLDSFCVHEIYEDNTPREVFYYEYNDYVYFATSVIDDECANNA